MKKMKKLLSIIAVLLMVFCMTISPKLTSGETYTLLAGDTTTTVTLDSLVKSVKK